MATAEQAGSSKSPNGLRRYRGLSWVGWLNIVLLQWFFVRLAYRTEEDERISGWGFCFALPFWGRVLTKAWIWPKSRTAPAVAFDYKTADGVVRRELRQPDDVFDDVTRSGR